MRRDELPVTDDATAVSGPPERSEIEERYRWDLSKIFPDWEAWSAACDRLEGMIESVRGYQGSLADGGERLLEFLGLADDAGRLAYQVWYYPSLAYDEDQRNNELNAKRQRVQGLFAAWQQAEAWFKPELLGLDRSLVASWLDDVPGLDLYRFKIEDLFRMEAHVLGHEGETVLSRASRFADSPDDAYDALSTADMQFPDVTLSSGESVTVTYAQYRALLATNRNQGDRRLAFEALYGAYENTINTYAALYNAVAQRDWFLASSRGYDSTLAGALFGNAIPTSVVEQLIATTRAGTGPFQRYHRLRREALGLETYHLYDTSIPIVLDDTRFSWEEAVSLVDASVGPLGEAYHERLRSSFAGRWIDVFENRGKRSGAYSAGVYGVHPYVLMNYNETLNDVFTLAHEMGHSMHTLLSFETQPFAYASYTTFVAEVASTLNESLLLDHLLERTDCPKERVVLLQHAIDGIMGTFFTQVLFAEWELEAHRMVERGEPITADSLSGLYRGILEHYYGDAATLDEPYRHTWARIPHFFHSPFYVFQYATSFAASARIFREMQEAAPADREALVERYLSLLRSGGNDHPIEQLAKAGVDLTEPAPVEAVIGRLDELVDELAEAAALVTA